MKIDFESERASFRSDILITPTDGVSFSKGKIVIAPKREDATYTISGYFDGQIVCSTKNTILKLDGAFLENREGKSALKCNAKTEIASVRKSKNYIVSTGFNFSRTGALQSNRTLILGGSGELFVCGGSCHGIEADDVKIKGSGKLVVQGTKNGSALKCESLEVEKDKQFVAYFLNSKNGIKADNSIFISSGTFFLYNNSTALKTKTSHVSKKKAHSIELSGGTFHLFSNQKSAETDDGAFLSEGAEIFEERE